MSIQVRIPTPLRRFTNGADEVGKPPSELSLAAKPALVAVFLTPLFEKLPEATLGAIVIAVGVGLFQADAAGVLTTYDLMRALVLGVLFGSLLASCVVLEARRWRKRSRKSS